MELLHKNISELNYKTIKSEVDNIDIRHMLNNESLDALINLLALDSRKNVKALSEKIEREKEKMKNEIDRVKEMYSFDRSFGDYRCIAGVDEVGRGPLAGPIVSCAVILDLDTIDDDIILWLNDSKKISEKKRVELAEIIKVKAHAYNIAECSNEEIDKEGIAYCNNKVFLDACNGLEVNPDLVLSDGYLIKNIEITNHSVIKGDTKSACIAAASIIAKVYRDNLMKEFGKEYPYYGFEDNVGYGTAKHIEGINKVGPSKIHRKTFLKNIL